MHKQTLKNLRDFLNHTTFEQFCEIVYPDFRHDESAGYLKSKFLLFQHNLGLYLSELDEKRFECLAAAIPVEGDICIADEKTSAPKQTIGLS